MNVFSIMLLISLHGLQLLGAIRVGRTSVTTCKETLQMLPDIPDDVFYQGEHVNMSAVDR